MSVSTGCVVLSCIALGVATTALLASSRDGMTAGVGSGKRAGIGDGVGSGKRGGIGAGMGPEAASSGVLLVLARGGGAVTVLSSTLSVEGRTLEVTAPVVARLFDRSSPKAVET